MKNITRFGPECVKFYNFRVLPRKEKILHFSSVTNFKHWFSNQIRGGGVIVQVYLLSPFLALSCNHSRQRLLSSPTHTYHTIHKQRTLLATPRFR